MDSTTIRVIGIDEWPLFRDFRFRALQSSPEHIGGVIEEERAWDESQWRAQLRKFDFVLAAIEGETVGGMTIEKLKGDFGATCWIGSCWIDPAHRGKKLLRNMMNYVDSRASELGWSVQGLGVWVDNFDAIASYEKLGFVKMGPEMPTTRSNEPGRHYQRMIRKSRSQ